MATMDVAVRAECPAGCGRKFVAAWMWESPEGGRLNALSDFCAQQYCDCDCSIDELKEAALERHDEIEQQNARRGIYCAAVQEF